MGGQRAIAFLYKSLATKVSLQAISVKENESTWFDIKHGLPSSFSKYLNPSIYFRVRSLMKASHITHLLFEHPYYAWLIFLLAKKGDCKIIIHSHNIESIRFKSIGTWWWKILWHYERWAFKHADYIWFITPEDRQFAIQHYSTSASKCHVVSYGVEESNLPPESELQISRNQLVLTHQLKSNTFILLFNGALSYKPNEDAVKYIIEDINPLLLASGLDYKIIICGKGLSSSFNNLSEYADKNIVYAGFVEDIGVYFKGCDVFLNPTTDGGGIKTKLVEALGAGKKCVSTENGAFGIDQAVCGGRLKIVKDHDWAAFAQAVKNACLENITNDHQAFYSKYNFDIIAKHALQTLAS